MIDLIAVGVAAIIVTLIFIGSELSDISHQLSEIIDALVDIRDAERLRRRLQPAIETRFGTSVSGPADFQS